MRKLLDQTESDADDVAPEHAFAGQGAGPEQKDLAHFARGHAQRFEEADRRDFLEEDDQDRGDHVEAGYDDHQRQDHQDIGVEQRQPVEEMAVQRFDIRHEERVVVFLRVQENQLFDAGAHPLDGSARGCADFDGRDLVPCPSVEPLYVPAVGHGHLGVNLLKLGVVDAAELELAYLHLVADEIDDHIVAHGETELGGRGAREQDVVGNAAVIVRQLAFHQTVAEEREIVERIHALEIQPVDVVVGLDQTRAPGYAGEAGDAAFREDLFAIRQILRKRIELIERRLAGLDQHHRAHEARRPVADFPFETRDHGEGDDHDGDAQTDRHPGNRVAGAALTVVAVGEFRRYEATGAHSKA